MAYQTIYTRRKYVFGEVSSAMQKAIRRADARLAGYFAIELFESGYHHYVWKRLLTISAEDCAGIITKEIAALKWSFDLINEKKKGDKTPGRIFIAKAIILLCEQPKSRDADHLTNLIYDAKSIEEDSIAKALADESLLSDYQPIPDYAYDVHTQAGRIQGATKKDFFIQEHEALKPRQTGLFDQDLQKLKKIS